MRLNCQHCGGPISSEDVQPDQTSARCSYCGTLYDLSAGPSDAQRAGAVPEARRAAIPIPDRFQVEEFPEGVGIWWRWFDVKHVLMLSFCVSWFALLYIWYRNALARHDLVALLFPLLHVAVGVGMAYGTFAGFLNSTRIEVRDGRLTLRHGPIPWRGNVSIARADLDQLYCQQRLGKDEDGKVFRTYDLMALLRDGRSRKLLTRLLEVNQALYLESCLERCLRIVDRPVEGEVNKRVA